MFTATLSLENGGFFAHIKCSARTLIEIDSRCMGKVAEVSPPRLACCMRIDRESQSKTWFRQNDDSMRPSLCLEIIRHAIRAAGDDLAGAVAAGPDVGDQEIAAAGSRRGWRFVDNGEMPRQC